MNETCASSKLIDGRVPQSSFHPVHPTRQSSILTRSSQTWSLRDRVYPTLPRHRLGRMPRRASSPMYVTSSMQVQTPEDKCIIIVLLGMVLFHFQINYNFVLLDVGGKCDAYAPYRDIGHEFA